MASQSKHAAEAKAKRQPTPDFERAPGSAEEFAASDEPRCRAGGSACIDCLMWGECIANEQMRQDRQQ